MSQRRNLSYVVNGSSKNSDVSSRQSRTLVLRDSNESILSECLTLIILSSSSYVKNDVEKEHKKEESINNENVNV